MYSAFESQEENVSRLSASTSHYLLRGNPQEHQWHRLPSLNHTISLVQGCRTSRENCGQPGRLPLSCLQVRRLFLQIELECSVMIIEALQNVLREATAAWRGRVGQKFPSRLLVYSRSKFPRRKLLGLAKSQLCSRSPRTNRLENCPEQTVPKPLRHNVCENGVVPPDKQTSGLPNQGWQLICSPLVGAPSNAWTVLCNVSKHAPNNMTEPNN